MPVKPIPDGYHSVAPYLVVEGAARLLEFLEQTFDAEVRLNMQSPDGMIKHAEISIGDSVVMLSEAQGEWKAMPAMVHVYVADVDDAYRRALEAGATSLMAPADRFYGDRNGSVRDMCGNVWAISTHVEDVSHEDLIKRAQAQAQS